MRPFFPFYGSKWNIARHYPRPVHDLVIEPFAGGAGYATFYDARRAHLYDADPIIAGVWSYLMRTSVVEILALPMIEEVGDSVDNYRLPQEAKWLVGFWLNRGSATPKKARTAYSARTDRGQLNWGIRAKHRIASQLHALEDWPYGDKGKFYRVKFDEFHRLGPWCMSRQGQIVVCEGEGAGWLPFETLGDFKTTKGRSTEAVFIRGGELSLFAETSAESATAAPNAPTPDVAEA